MIHQENRWLAALSQALLMFWAVAVILPMVWMIFSSLKTDQELFFSPWSPPQELQWNNFARAWTNAHVGDFFLNTLIVVIPSLVFTLIISAMTAYVLARFQFPGRTFIFYLFLRLFFAYLDLFI